MESGNPFDTNNQQNDGTNPFDDVSYQPTQVDSQSIPQENEQPYQQDDDGEYAQHVRMFDDHPEEAQQLDNQIQTDLATPCPSTIEVDGQVYENVKVKDISLDLPQSEETPVEQQIETPVTQQIETPVTQEEQEDDAQHVRMFDDHPEEAQQLDNQIQTDLATPCPSTIEVDGQVYENVKVKDVSLDLPQSEETPISQPIETPVAQEEQEDDAQHIHMFDDHPEAAKQIDESIQKDLSTPCPSTVEIDGQVFENVRVKDIEVNNSIPSNISNSKVEETIDDYQQLEKINESNIKQAKDAQKMQEQNEEEKRKQREIERQKQLEQIRKRQQESCVDVKQTELIEEEKRKKREQERRKQLEEFRNRQHVSSS